MSVLLDGFCVGGYRSFGEPQFIGPLTKVNVFAGPNNNGKSNLLRFVDQHLPKIRSKPSETSRLTGIDRPLKGETELVVGLAACRASESVQSVLTKATRKEHVDIIDALFTYSPITRSDRDGTLLWFVKKPHEGRGLQNSLNMEALCRELEIPGSHWKMLFDTVKPGFTGGQMAGWANTILHEFLSPFSKPSMETAFIDAIRQVTGDSDHNFSGKGLIHKLLPLQNPDYDQQDDRRKFENIELFVREIMENDSVKLEIPHSKKSIVLHMDGKSLPLESLGTGIHEVVILAAACTLLERTVICLEEPEIHLHPIFQRKLLKYLHDKTSNQYLIATHSAHILDASEATVFHVTMEEGETRVRQIVSAQHRWDVARELGARASDIVQCNSAIWVEGPSDRIYLNHWIRAVDPSLLEGVHYSILFYGGKVLANFTAEHDPEVNDLVSMLAANRHSAIVMDRDRANSIDPINATKLRVQEEIVAAGGCCWVTEGREIENYVDRQTLEGAIRTVNRSVELPKSWSKFSKVMPRRVDKVKAAFHVAASPPDLSKLDLRERIVELVNFIRGANHRPKLP